MIRSMFSGVAGLRTHQSKMDVIGNNIANVNTNGYKTARAIFKESIYQTSINGSGGNDVNGGINPSQVGYGAQIAAIDVDYNTASYEPTGYGTDCMIDGNGFFMVGNKLGEDDGDGVANTDDDPSASSLMLTRVGAFKFDGDGYLVDSNGNVVYGFVAELAATGTDEMEVDEEVLVPIRIPDAAGAYTDDDGAELLNLSDLSIGSDGVISGTASDGTIYKFAIVAVANVPNPNGLDKLGSSYYKARNNTGDVIAYSPGEGTTGALISNGLEMSNVDLATELSNMINRQGQGNGFGKAGRRG